MNVTIIDVESYKSKLKGLKDVRKLLHPELMDNGRDRDWCPPKAK